MRLRSRYFVTFFSCNDRAAFSNDLESVRRNHAVSNDAFSIGVKSSRTIEKSNDLFYNRHHFIIFKFQLLL